jgi:hypothetical protein
MVFKKIMFLVLAATTLIFASCKKDPVNQIDNNNSNTRVIVYSIGGEEERITLNNDSEWDALLDAFCGDAQNGDAVVFYNINNQPHFGAKTMCAPKSVSTFSTTSREKMKEWMKQMEKEGKTVNVTYDNNSGTWNGTAYATIPTIQSSDCHTGIITCVEMPATSEDPTSSDMVAALRINEDTTLILVNEGKMMVCIGDAPEDTITLCGTIETYQDINDNEYLVLDISSVSEASIIGTWNLTCLTTTDFNSGSDYLLHTTVYTPADNESILFQFFDNGIITKTIITASSTTTENGSWSLSDNGEICCSLLIDDNGCWNINWLTNNTMIISRESNGNIFSQFQFDAVE